MEKLIDEILAIYRRIGRGEIEEEEEARKKLRRTIKRYERKIMIPVALEHANKVVDEHLGKHNNGKKFEIEWEKK